MIKKIVCIIGLFLLAGCLGGYSPESTFYTLKTIDEAKPVSQTNISIGVDLPELPEYADRPQIVSYSKSGSLNIDETNRWGEDLDIMLQRVIANDLRGYLPKAGIKPRTSLLEKYRYILNVSVVKFDLIENNRAYFEALWTVKSGNTFNVVYKGKTSLEMKTKGGYNQYVDAMSKMVGQMSEQIAQKLVKN